MGELGAFVGTKECDADLEVGLSSVKGRRGGCIGKSTKERARCENSEKLHIDFHGGTVFAFCKGFWRLVDWSEVMRLISKCGRETS